MEASILFLDEKAGSDSGGSSRPNEGGREVLLEPFCHRVIFHWGHGIEGTIRRFGTLNEGDLMIYVTVGR